jgi:NitT/TauT family transport system substrate-binding protein/putative hydroxymethylpyrimidine transport system substrate-binding protein
MRRLATAPVLAVAAVLLAALLGGCGSVQAGGTARSATVVLDFQPNAVHAGIYAALQHRYDVRAGARVRVIVPSASTDSIKLLATGRADFAILDIHDLAIARERGENIVGIMALVQRPLAAVIAAPQIRRPRGLQGQTVGVTGLPSDTAVLHSVVAGDGGAPAKVHTVTIGFNAVADLLADRVTGATAFWNDEGVTLQRGRPGFHVFRVDRYGAPSYPELVLCATATRLRSDPVLARDVVRAFVRGYDAVLADPQAAARALETRVPGLDPKLVAPELHALLPAFRLPGGTVGQLDPARLQAWARWEVRFGIVRRAPDVGATFDRSFVAVG